MTLATIDNIKNELRVDSKGVGYISIRGAAHICGISHLTLVENLGGRKNSGDDFLRTKLGRKLAQYSFRGDDFLNGISDVALSLIIEYYAFEANQTTPEAQMMMRTMAVVGLRTLIRQACGWNEQPAPMTPEEMMARSLLYAKEKLDAAEKTIDILYQLHR